MLTREGSRKFGVCAHGPRYSHVRMDPATAMCTWTPLQPCAHVPHYSHVRMCPATAVCTYVPHYSRVRMCPATAMYPSPP